MGNPTAAELPDGSRQRRLTWGLLAATAAIILAHAPLLIRLGQRMWETEHYQFFPLILVGSIYLGYRCWIESSEALTPLSPGRRPVRVALSFASMLVLAIAILADSPWLAAISFMLTSASVVYLIGGMKLIRVFLPAWSFLWLSVPLPLGLDQYLIQQLQQTATQFASGLLDLLGYRHFVSGVVLELPGRSFEVEEACSGIHSLFAAITCTVLYAVLMHRGILRITILALLAVLWVLIVNAARVTAITALCERWDLPIADGFGHDLVGGIAFLTCMMLLVSTERLLLFFFPYPFHLVDYFNFRQKRRTTKKSSSSKTNRTAPSRSQSTDANDKTSSPLTPSTSRRAIPSKVERNTGRLEGIPLAMLGVILLFGQFTFGGLLGNVDVSQEGLTQISQTSEGSMPIRIDSWQRTGFERIVRAVGDENGEFSRIWKYQQDNLTGLVSIDGPFVGWHNLGNCLAGQGWTIEETTIETHKSQPGAQEVPYVRMSVRKGLGQCAEVFYAVLDGQGAPAKPAETYLAFRAIRRFPKLAELLERFSGTDDAAFASSDSTTFQVQLFHESTEPASDEIADELRRLFTSAVQRVRNGFLDEDGSSTP
jgi:exosortase